MGKTAARARKSGSWVLGSMGYRRRARVEVSLRLSLTTKIFLAFAFLLGTFLFLALYSVQEFQEVGEDLRSVNEGHLALARLVGQIETHQQNRFRDLRRSVDGGDRRSQELVLRIVAGYFPSVIRARTEEARDICSRQLSRASRRAETESDSKVEFYRDVESSIDRLAVLHEDVNELNETLLQRVQKEQPFEELRTELDRLERRILQEELPRLSQRISEETERTAQRAERDERRAIWRVLALTALALLVGLFLTVISARALAPISRLVSFARAISRGDYEQKMMPRGDDELSALAEELTAMARAQKQREEELSRQRAELERAYHRVDELKRYHERIVKSLSTAIVVTDRNLAITSTNRAAEAHFSLSGAELRNQPLSELPLGQSLTQAVGSLETLLELGNSAEVSALAYGDLLVDVALFPLLGERGEVLGLVIAIEDVTEAVRTKEALIRSERLAAIGRMSAHVTHEVRNPLSSIGLNAELLEDLIRDVSLRTEDGGESVTEARRVCQAIGREVDRLNAITEAYLRFARLPRPKTRPAQLGPLLRDLADFVRGDLQAARVSLELVVEPELPEVEIDEDQMRQALLNLLRNGKESMPEGGRLELDARLRGSDRLVISLADHGLGIEPANQERIFDPFFSTKLTGTGLGLALTQQIVGEHGGTLEVESELGAGSTFRVVLPVVQASRIEGVFSPDTPRERGASIEAPDLSPDSAGAPSGAQAEARARAKSSPEA